MDRDRFHIALIYRGPQHEGRDEFSSFVPVGLFYILKSLLAAGFDASLHNLSGLPRRRLGKVVRAIGADAVLLSAFFGCHRQAFAIADLVKKYQPQCPVVLGGPLAVLAEEVLRRVSAVDFVIRGEGEVAVVRLLDALLAGRGRPEEIAGVYRRAGGRIVGRSPEFLDDIDRFFFVPSELIPHCHGVRPENFAVLISSRGCPFRCSFCSSAVLWQNRLRYHNPDLLIRYLRDLRQATGALYFSLRDENFLARRRHVLAFTRKLRRSGLYYLWNSQGSAGFLDDELAAEMAAAGCDQVQMGIETVSPRLQQILGKKNEPDRIRSVVAMLRRHAIRPFGYFIYGMGENGEELRENLEFIHGSGLLDAVASPLVYYPGTALAGNLSAGCFFGRKELLFYDPASARRHRQAYEKTLARLAATADFRLKELSRGGSSGMVANLARHFYYLRRGKWREAEKILLSCQRHQPENPWPPKMLAGLYAELGRQQQAAAMRRLAEKLVGRS